MYRGDRSNPPRTQLPPPHYLFRPGFVVPPPGQMDFREDRRSPQNFQFAPEVSIFL